MRSHGSAARTEIEIRAIQTPCPKRAASGLGVVAESDLA
jgi:hypothetical protein